MNVMSYAKRLTALLLCAVLLLGLMPVGAFAAETEGETTAPTGETTAPAEETTAPVEETESENSVMPLADAVPGTATVPGSVTTYAENVYVKTDSLTAGGQYLIVNVESGNGVALSNNNGTISSASVNVLLGDDGAFIVLDDTTAVWTAGEGITLTNNGSTLGMNNVGSSWSFSGELAIGGEYGSWTYQNNTLFQQNDRCGTWYLNYGNNAWSVSQSQQNIYLYEYRAEGTTATVPDVTHSIAITSDSVVVTALTCDTAMPGSTLQLGSKFVSDPTGYELTGTPSWSVTTSNGVASVDESGLVTFTGVEGTETIRVSYTWTVGENTYTIYSDVVITAKLPVFALSVTEESAALKIGATQTMTAVRLMNGTAIAEDSNPIVWSSSDETIATVDQSGMVTAVAEGNATITASWVDPLGNTRTDTVAVSVVDAIYTLDINEGSAHVETAVTAGNTLQLTATLTIDGETIENPTLHWSVDNGAVATVDSATGLVTFTGYEGRVVVTVTYTTGTGKEITDTFVITAREAEHVLPEDGTNDFPEYPNEGAIRIDKNASAVGNFSQTGIALVELSMTGVPYSAGNEIDVVIMIDMSTSMKQSTNGVADRVTPARNAANSALEAIVKNEDGTINNNRVAVYTFNGYDGTGTQNYANAVDEVLELKSYQNADDKTDTTNLTNAQSSITTAIQEDKTDSGTNYGAALEKCYSVLKAAKEEHPDRKQFVIFVTDGEPTTGFAYETEDGGVADDGYNSQYENGAADVYYTYTEYYSKKMREAGVEVYSVGIQLDNTNANTILKKIGGNSTGTAYANADTHADYAQFIDADESADKLIEIFEGIVNAIKEAATNVTVTDKITDEYTLILNTPANVTLPEGTELTIDVKQYTLDENKNRTGDPVVIESVSVNDTDKVTLDADGNIVSIDADTFSYDASTHIITWKADKLDSTELALSYYLYLKESAGYDPEDQTAPGPYPTNEYATIDYTNHLDHQCRKEFPVPQLTWNGAQVSYTFYLVNSQGQPVNRAGRVIPFAEAIYVTEVVTESITWDTDDDKLLNANYIAQEYLPDVYSLYDPNTAYTINVYEDENGVDKNNYFKIAADKLFDDGTSTTKVFNTKTGTIYSAPGTYTSANASGFDFATTTVAFAVVWNPALAEDTMVVDFGLDVVIDVATNDSLETEVVGLRTEKPNSTINTGLITPTNTQSIDIIIDGVKVATAEVENQTSIRFVLDEENGMLFNKAVTFYYESKVEYYQNDVLQTSYMYSSVTVIPATTIYYEDSYVTLKTFIGTTVENEDGTTTTTYTETSGWEAVGTAANSTQAQDRPGKSQISATIDADNNYGYDAAYKAMSEYSMGSAVVANVNTGKYATAEFEFYGTGFDVISLTDNTTGTIVVEVLDSDGARVLKETVNTYYGYKLCIYDVTYTYNAESGNWVETNRVAIENKNSIVEAPENPADGDTYTTTEIRWETTDSSDVNALYQVPVIKIGDGQTTEKLTYGKYKVIITATYIPILDSNKSDEGYKFYLDAIRIYNPTGNQDDTANDAYIEDGEAYPEYFELRDKIIEKNTFDALTTDTLEGVVFIDGNTAEKDVASYTSYGPNNEVYLAAGQAVSFELSATGPVAKVQIALKSVGGSASVKIYSADGVTALDEDINTATDMYYDITSMNGKTVVITNDGDGILSITNVKVTYTSDPNGTATTMFMVRRASVNAALDTMNVVEPEVPETTVPETTVPETEVPETETTVPEETEPETTEPETTEPEETEPETEAPTEKPTEPNPEEIIKKTVGKIIKKIFGWLFG